MKTVILSLSKGVTGNIARYSGEWNEFAAFMLLMILPLFFCVSYLLVNLNLCKAQSDTLVRSWEPSGAWASRSQEPSSFCHVDYKYWLYDRRLFPRAGSGHTFDLGSTYRAGPSWWRLQIPAVPSVMRGHRNTWVGCSHTDTAGNR